jgi:hypothetical protein
MSNLPVNAAESLPASTKIDYQNTPAGIIPRTVDEALTIAKAFAAGGLFPDIKNAGMAVTKIIAGAEFGLTPTAAMNSFHIVQGKISMHYALIGSLIKRSRSYNFRVLEKSDERCEIAFYEDGEEIGREVFTAADAKRQGTQNMAKFPATMLYARCLTNGARTYCPDVFGGQPIYTPDEIEEEAAKVKPPTDRGDQILDHLRSQMPAKPAEAQLSPEGAALERLAGEFGMTDTEIRDFQTWAESNGLDWVSVANNPASKTTNDLYALEGQPGLL